MCIFKIYVVINVIVDCDQYYLSHYINNEKFNCKSYVSFEGMFFSCCISTWFLYNDTVKTWSNKEKVK